MSDQLRRIEEKIIEIAVDVAVIKSNVSEQKDDLTSLNHTVNGNGKAGMKVEVEMLKRAKVKTDKVIVGVSITLLALIIQLVFGIV